MSCEVFLPSNFECNHKTDCDPICRMSHPKILNCNKKLELIKVLDGNTAYLLCSFCGGKMNKVIDNDILKITKVKR